jgi:environmental stress-induced protein Ves
MEEGCKIERLEERLVRWKNGLGFTRELLIQPPNVDFAKESFFLRISSAKIESGSTQFSRFPDHQRLLLVLDEGVNLKHGGGATFPMEIFAWHEFEGGAETVCEASSPTEDLNVMWNKSHLAVTAFVVKNKKHFVEKDSFVFLIDGHGGGLLDRRQLGRVVKAGFFGGEDAIFAIVKTIKL